jgi:hypothetical protein
MSSRKVRSKATPCLRILCCRGVPALVLTSRHDLALAAQLRARMPLSMREIVTAHSLAAQQARDAFEDHLNGNVASLHQPSLFPAAADSAPPAPSAFGFLQEDPTPQPASEPSAFDFLQTASVPTAGGEGLGADAAVIEPGAAMDIAADFQEYRAALECELCQWRVPAGTR